MSFNRLRRKIASPNTITRYTKEGFPYEVDKVTGQSVFDEDLNARFMTAKKDATSYKYGNILIDDNDKYMPQNDGKGTIDNPLHLSSDDEDNNDKNENDKNGDDMATTNGNGNLQSNNSNDDDTVQDVTPITTDIVDEQGNIKLKAAGFTIYTNRIKMLDKPVLFKEETMEIPIDLKTIQPNTSLKNDITLIINYSDLLKFTFTFLKDNGTLMINTKLFSFTKYWLKEPKTFTNREFGIPGDILIKGIEKKHYLLLKDLLIDKSCWIKLLFKTEESGKVTNNVVITYPPLKDNPNIIDIVKITEDDLLRLEPSNYLNDNLIDFYIRYIKKHYVHPGEEDRFYFFSTFFYNNLSLKNIEEAYKRISKWTRDTDIFTKDFLFIPINESFHWTLCIVSFCGQDPKTATSENRPLIMHLDSLGGSGKHQFHSKIRSYLSMEWKYKKSIPSNGAIPEREFTSTTLPAARVYIPKQDNLYDCGVFMLHYIELFCRSPETNFDQPLKRPKWFALSDIPEKRNTMKTLILSLKEEEEFDKEDHPPDVTKDTKEGEEETVNVDDTPKKKDKEDGEENKEKEGEKEKEVDIDGNSRKEIDDMDTVKILIDDDQSSTSKKDVVKRKRQQNEEEEGSQASDLVDLDNSSNTTTTTTTMTTINEVKEDDKEVNNQQQKKKKMEKEKDKNKNSTLEDRDLLEVKVVVELEDDEKEKEEEQKPEEVDIGTKDKENGNNRDNEKGNGNGNGNEKETDSNNKMDMTPTNDETNVQEDGNEKEKENKDQNSTNDNSNCDTIMTSTDTSTSLTTTSTTDPSILETTKDNNNNTTDQNGNEHDVTPPLTTTETDK